MLPLIDCIRSRVRPSLMLWLSIMSIILSTGLTPAQAADSTAATKAGIEFFEKHIRPVLVSKCYDCHSEESGTAEGGLLLDTRAGIRRGGDKAAAVVPMDATNSLLLKAIRYDDPDFQMPPDEPLPGEVVRNFEKWIAMGAPDPRDGGAIGSLIDIEEGRQHWSFQPISNPPVPQVRNTSWPRTDIDRFVLAAIEEQGLQPVSDALPHELRRRIFFDLTGFPPDSESMARPMEEPTSLVDELLASPQFGERWGRHWLDVARYADSSGGSYNVMFPLAFRYRDWVIDSFNADKPYDQFIREQIAGDLLPGDDDDHRNEQVTGTGFLAIGLKELAEKDVERFRMEMADEQIDATSRAFLGLTIACARCHDHKFDPIPTSDYYALAGIFLSSEPQLGAQRNRQRAPFATGVILLSGSPVAFSETDQQDLVNLSVSRIMTGLEVRNEKYRILRNRNLPQKQSGEFNKLDDIPSVRKAIQNRDRVQARWQAILKEYDAALPYAVMGMRETQPIDCAIHIRGDDSQLGDVVSRGFPKVLTTPDTIPINPKHSGRLELAQWIADPRNPLTARVMANRIWQHLFGVGLVETPDDFGNTGQPPSNPELLDHLAQRFIAQGWSVKALIREIMSSRVYQLSTMHNDRAYEIDQANRLCWRMNRRRLSSDALLDAVRFVSGDLNPERPGPVILPTPKDPRIKSMNLGPFAQSRKHRTVYQLVLRQRIPDEWELFDFPAPELVSGLRGVTTVPTQALYFMNSPFIVEQSGMAARRLLDGNTNSASSEVATAAFELILNRPPDDAELMDAVNLLQQFQLADASQEKGVAVLCQSLFASAEFRSLY